MGTPDMLSKPSNEPQQEQRILIRERLRSMERSLNEIKVTLGTLKAACTSLEAQTEKFSKEMVAMKRIMLLETPPAEESPPRTQENHGIQHLLQNRGPQPVTELARRPGILHRINDSIGRIVHPDHISTAIFTPPETELLGKRRLQEDTDDGIDESASLDNQPTQRANKRVRFADPNDLPISHVRTPMHQLDTASGFSDLSLPKPRRILLKLGRDTEQVLSESRGDSPVEPLASPISPPNSPIILPLGKTRNTRRRFRDNMTYLQSTQHSRPKTKWDPAAGKRVPIVTVPSPSMSGEESDRSEMGAGMKAEQEDYEGKLSHDLSNTSLG
ncbi:hypothetical protein JR316_0002788 [Psilocybe cubensis]|uniref:Uncharacterized protein n=2 Tax=Psilocybe cubensis TaxID=181762 RepID=A0ACB8HD85_PSICU|nr:hypothetical protein JR316_0002788 [Psilocybe cubensis]KAH9485873.1 hypothetical protein JR316_0002788 [Psilocybe cubensis]